MEKVGNQGDQPLSEEPASQADVTGAAKTSCPTERVGVLLVHGIGEQPRYRHLEDEVMALVAALRQVAPDALFKLTVLSDSGDVPGATRCRWPDHEQAPAVVEIERDNGRVTEVCFREVWWADLGHEVNLRAFLHFLVWATSMWTHPDPAPSSLPGASRVRLIGEDKVGDAPQIRARHRLYLFALGLFLWLLLPLWGLSRALRLTNLNLPVTATRYLGDVKLYQDERRAGVERLEDGGLKPRVAIRRRMVCALTQMAMEKYDRWYLLGHSLGSVVAFNGLMETEQCLPALLSPALVKRAESEGVAINAPSAQRRVTKDEYRDMLPPRRAAMGLDLIISRERLFERLAGFVTYGSPLERFRVLWPKLIPVNREAENCGAPLEKTKWVNIRDPSDAVAPPLISFDKRGSESLHPPINLAYSAGAWPLASHVAYLRGKRGKTATKAIARWLLDGHQTLEKAHGTWLARTSPWYMVRAVSQYAAWLVLLAATISAVGLLLDASIDLLRAWASTSEAALAPFVAAALPAEDWQTLVAWTAMPVSGVVWMLIVGAVRGYQRKYAPDGAAARQPAASQTARAPSVP